jgi:hypothetical protein
MNGERVLYVALQVVSDAARRVGLHR